MPDSINIHYTCEKCLSTRRFQLEFGSHADQIFVPEEAKNGLFLYSDVHRCQNGILGINNLHIDHNHAVRSYEYLILPAEKKNKQTISGLPKPNVPKLEFTTYRVTGMSSSMELRLIIRDRDLGINMILGNIYPEDEDPLFAITSKRSGIELEFYKSEIEGGIYVKQWFQVLIDLLEILPPTKLGLFIDTLRYISTLVKIPPIDFHITMLKSILVSHEILFILNTQIHDHQRLIKENEELYGDEIIQQMINIVMTLKQSPNSSLQQFTNIQRKAISDLIYIFLLLEQDGIITIQRPPEIKV